MTSKNQCFTSAAWPSYLFMTSTPALSSSYLSLQSTPAYLNYSQKCLKGKGSNVEYIKMHPQLVTHIRLSHCHLVFSNFCNNVDQIVCEGAAVWPDD